MPAFGILLTFASQSARKRQALPVYKCAILEIKLEMENEPEVSKIPEASTRKKLKRYG